MKKRKRIKKQIKEVRIEESLLRNTKSQKLEAIKTIINAIRRNNARTYQARTPQFRNEYCG